MNRLYYTLDMNSFEIRGPFYFDEVIKFLERGSGVEVLKVVVDSFGIIQIGVVRWY